jgi:hypothetical protein
MVLLPVGRALAGSTNDGMHTTRNKLGLQAKTATASVLQAYSIIGTRFSRIIKLLL